MSTQNPKVWLVTGCSTGFGRYIAEHLLEAGEKVVVTAQLSGIDTVALCRARGDSGAAAVVIRSFPLAAPAHA